MQILIEYATYETAAVENEWQHNDAGYDTYMDEATTYPCPKRLLALLTFEDPTNVQDYFTGIMCQWLTVKDILAKESMIS